jgi:hypothetical protein
LGGYTLMKEVPGERPWVPLPMSEEQPRIPLAAMLQISLTHTESTAGTDASEFPRNDDAVLQQFSLFYAGRIVDHPAGSDPNSGSCALVEGTIDSNGWCMAFSAKADRAPIGRRDLPVRGGESHAYSRSMIAAIPWPPPIHMVMSP